MVPDMNSKPRLLAIVLASGCLLLPATGLQAKKDKNPAPSEWYVKTSLSVTEPGSGNVISDTRSGIFGQLAVSEPGYDRHDIPAYSSTTKSKAAVVFVQGENWGDNAGEYLSDYRPAGEDSTDWLFTVHSSLGSEQVTLNWDGLFLLTQENVNGARRYTEEKTLDHEILRDLKLIDLETGAVTRAIHPGKGKKNGAPELNSHIFSMKEETSRQFRWVLGKVRDEHFQLPNSEVASLQSNKSSNKSRKQSLSTLQIQQMEAANALERNVPRDSE